MTTTTQYTVYATDTTFTASSAELTSAEWTIWQEIARRGDPRRAPKAYEVRRGLTALERVVRAVFAAPIPMGRSVTIDDDGRIAEAVASIRAAVVVAQAAASPAAPLHRCAGGHGCRNMVRVQGSLCDHCSHDED